MWSVDSSVPPQRQAGVGGQGLEAGVGVHEAASCNGHADGTEQGVSYKWQGALVPHHQRQEEEQQCC